MKITCNIIEDLMPLYVDEVLSDDSCHLVEEHISSCESCKKELEMLKQEKPVFEKDIPAQITDIEVKKSFQGVRRAIVKKRILTACAAVVCVLAVLRVGYYFYAEKETYVSLEESGLEMRGDGLYATKTYYGRLKGRVSPNQKVLFYYETETGEIRKMYPAEDCDILVTDFGKQLEDPEEWEKKENENRMRGIEKVYYLPEEYVDYAFDYDDPEIGEKQTKELEEVSVLLWEKE